MKCILQGFGDYIKDCWHDFLFRNLQKYYGGRPIKFISIATGRLLNVTIWKEGNLWHYIQQRRIAKQRSK